MITSYGRQDPQNEVAVTSCNAVNVGFEENLRGKCRCAILMHRLKAKAPCGSNRSHRSEF